MIIGVVDGIVGRRKDFEDVRTETWMSSPGSRVERYVDATPTCRLPRPEMASWSRIVTVRVQVSAVCSGDEEIEYWRIRIGGRRERYWLKGNGTVGNSSRRSRGLRRFWLTCVAKEAFARCERAVLSCSLVAALEIARTSWRWSVWV
jgi:hypothetical protein